MFIFMLHRSAFICFYLLFASVHNGQLGHIVDIGYLQKKQTFNNNSKNS